MYQGLTGITDEQTLGVVPDGGIAATAGLWLTTLLVPLVLRITLLRIGSILLKHRKGVTRFPRTTLIGVELAGHALGRHRSFHSG